MTWLLVILINVGPGPERAPVKIKEYPTEKACIAAGLEIHKYRLARGEKMPTYCLPVLP